MKKQILLLSAIITAFVGCELYEQDDYTEYYVVESYLVANDTLPQVRLSTTSPLTEQYSFKANAVSNADVEIRKLNADSSISETYSYQASKPGIYSPTGTNTVQDEQLYQLHVATAGGEVITSTTYVPENFKTVNELQDSYVYQSEQQIEIVTTPSSYISGRQTYYIFTVNAITPDSSELTPFYRDLVVNQDEAIKNYYKNSSGIINEGNYDRNANGNIELKVPWLAIAFYDTNDVVANAIDNNMYDFLRTQNVQTGGMNISPGEIKNIEYNIDGGIGIFGSLATDTNRVIITRSKN